MNCYWTTANCFLLHHDHICMAANIILLHSILLLTLPMRPNQFFYVFLPAYTWIFFILKKVGWCGIRSCDLQITAWLKWFTSRCSLIWRHKKFHSYFSKVLKILLTLDLSYPSRYVQSFSLYAVSQEHSIVLLLSLGFYDRTFCLELFRSVSDLQERKRVALHHCGWIDQKYGNKKSLPKFSSLEYLDGKPMVNKENPLLYFADVCAGPGGFSEYVLWRKKWKSKGFGFTLRGPNDFKLEDFFAGPRESLFIRLPGFVQALENLVWQCHDTTLELWLKASGGMSWNVTTFLILTKMILGEQTSRF